LGGEQAGGRVIRIDPGKQVDKTVRLANPPLAVAVRNGRVAQSATEADPFVVVVTALPL
jgi:hypothetical protein